MTPPHPLRRRRPPGGYVSYILVLTTAVTLLVMLLSHYRSALATQKVQSETVTAIDYAAKEEAILRALVTLVPNRAIRAMQHNSNQPDVRAQLQWRQIFFDALQQANAADAVSVDVLTALGRGGALNANPGDANFTLSNIESLFDPIEPDDHALHVSPATGRLIDGGAGYPPPLNTPNGTDRNRDTIYPLISHTKRYANRAQSRVGASVVDYPQFNQLIYPNVRFGYGAPGQPFVAKQNWWAFSMDLADLHDHLTGVENVERDYVFSIYEVPSQLAISAEAFAQVGQHADGSPWQNASIQGGVFATRAQVTENIALERIAGRRGLTIAPTATVGTAVAGADPFGPGTREAFEVANNGAYLPIFLASEAGRAAFIPINRGAEFFDRFATPEESNTISSTTWNNYSVGARQCAMHLDVTEVASPIDPKPMELTFSFLSGGARQQIGVPLEGYSTSGDLPQGFSFCANEGGVVDFDSPVDVAYGANGRFGYLYGVTGAVRFDDATFGESNPELGKQGFFRPSAPFERRIQGDRWCVALYPQRLGAFLAAVGGSPLDVNHSIAINADYLNNPDINPLWPSDYGVLLLECADLRAFTRGFSIVTNFRLYIGDHLNTASIPSPAPTVPSPHYPPLSLFSPEVRYGVDFIPTHVTHRGQRGSLAGDSENESDRVHLLDVKSGFETEMSHDRITANLSDLRHPAALPPITAMNWLITVEERKAEYFTP